MKRNWKNITRSVANALSEFFDTLFWLSVAGLLFLGAMYVLDRLGYKEIFDRLASGNILPYIVLLLSAFFLIAMYHRWRIPRK